MPLVVFDAMMHGRPVILSDTVGQKDFIKNSKNDFVFPVEDEGAMTSCMVKMTDPAADYPKMSAAIRKTFLDNFEFPNAKNHSGSNRRNHRHGLEKDQLRTEKNALPPGAGSSVQCSQYPVNFMLLNVVVS